MNNRSLFLNVGISMLAGLSEECWKRVFRLSRTAVEKVNFGRIYGWLFPVNGYLISRNRGILLASCGSKNWIYPGMEIADMLKSEAKPLQ